jgi:hypothetical protein
MMFLEVVAEVKCILDNIKCGAIRFAVVTKYESGSEIAIP